MILNWTSSMSDNNDESTPNKEEGNTNNTTDIASGREPVQTVFYPKKTVAVHAVAARALDLLRFVETGQVEPRLCVQDPSTLDVDSEFEFVNSTTLTVPATAKTKTKKSR
eukprot:CAMPEP_0172450230 /NCGR_PEP_ID=MMETSP1065-20121228/8665_1 /TAXON_ID=265537 /ORGANISM="Amphiprora paludosa, Strain CCMP125" /LENGTH=109 /DNA_ID=CAMNT_0013202009 /DNA_START=243 /DNA_END=572 /DNA_ORIENTATION=-